MNELKNCNYRLQNSSFGYHSPGSSGNVCCHQKTKWVDAAEKLRNITFVALAAIACLMALGIASFKVFVIGSAGFIGSSFLYYSSNYSNYKQICETAGIVFQNAEQVKKFEVSGLQGKCQAIPTEHCADTEVWREDLIKAAEHNIVLSGNYCGGTSFANFLRLVEAQIKKKPHLKVIILSSPNFIKNGNAKTIQKLSTQFPNNFSLVESPDIWHVSTGLKKSTNHTKCTVIDYGKYFILGGSGVKDNFAQTGLDHLTKDEFLKNQARQREIFGREIALKGDMCSSDLIDLPEQPPELPTLPISGETVFPLTNASQLPSSTLSLNPNADDGFIGKLIPGNFRDMDFVFRCEGGKNSIGKQVYKQMLLLCHRWQQYNRMLNNSFEPHHFNVNQLGVFTGRSTEINQEDNLVIQLLKTPIPNWDSIKTKVPYFDDSKKKSSDVACQIFASGPEHNFSKFAQELEKRIQSAKKRIVINHMYFHPSQRIMKALIEAAERGVNIKIITSGIYKDCPSSHFAFGPRNKCNYAYLINSLSEERKEAVEVYEFQQIKKGNHKKVILIDDRVIAGSSNLGYKSLETASDHELNFFARSKQFAEETMKICDLDIQYSKKIENPTILTTSDYFQAFLHKMMAPLIG